MKKIWFIVFLNFASCNLSKHSHQFILSFENDSVEIVPPPRTHRCCITVIHNYSSNIYIYMNDTRIESLSFDTKSSNWKKCQDWYHGILKIEAQFDETNSSEIKEDSIVIQVKFFDL